MAPRASYPDQQSRWWNEVDILPNLADEGSSSGGAKKWQCRYCQCVKRGSSARVRAHLLGVRNQGISLCPSVPAAELTRLTRIAAEVDSTPSARPLAPRAFVASHSSSRAAAGHTSSFSSVSAPGVGPSHAPGPSSSHGFAAPAATHSTEWRQRSMRAALEPGRKVRVDEAVARFFYSCDIPFHASRSPYFTDMVKEIASYGPSYVPPSYELLRTRLLESEKQAVDRALVIFREQWPFYGVSMIADGWSDTRSRSVHGILAYSRGKSCFIKAIDNSEGGKTAERLAEIWGEAIMEVGIEHVVQFIADGEPSNRAAGRIIEGIFPSICFTPCMAHCLNNLLKDIAKVEWVQPTLERCRGIVSFIT